MTLKELRILLKEYDQTWYARKLVYGDHARAIKFRQYLEQFNQKKDDYELNAADIFTLLQTIPEITVPHSDLQFIRSIKGQLDSNYLFDIYNVVNATRLIIRQNFTTLYALSYDGRTMLQSLFCGSPTQSIPLNAGTFAVALRIAAQPSIEREKGEQSLRFLHKKNHLTPRALKVLRTKLDDLPYIFQIVQELDKANCLNDTCIEYCAQSKLLFSFDTLMASLNRAKITLNDDLIKSIAANTNIHLLAKMIPIVLNAKKVLFNIETLQILLKQEHPFFLEKTPALQLLQEKLDITTYSGDMIPFIFQEKE